MLFTDSSLLDTPGSSVCSVKTVLGVQAFPRIVQVHMKHYHAEEQQQDMSQCLNPCLGSLDWQSRETFRLSLSTEIFTSWIQKHRLMFRIKILVWDQAHTTFGTHLGHRISCSSVSQFIVLPEWHHHPQWVTGD